MPSTVPRFVSPGLSRAITAIAALVSLVLAVLPPVGFYYVQRHSQKAVVLTEAQINARLAGRIVRGDGAIAPSDLASLNMLLGRRNPDKAPEVRAFLDTGGNVLAQSADTMSAPILEVREEVVDNGNVVGTLLIQRSLRAVAVETAVVALIAALLAVGAFFALRVIPLRSLRRALRENRKMGRDLAAAANKELATMHAVEIERGRQQATLRALLDSLPDVICYKDTTGMYMGCNKAYAAGLGMSMDQVVGRRDSDFLPPERADVIRARDELLYSNLQTQMYEEWITFADGKARWMQVMKAVFRDTNGEVIGQVGIGRDITEKKVAEDDMRRARDMAEEATRMKSDFLANMSHEIRTPMNAVLGLSHLLLKTELTGRQRDFVGKLESSGQHLMGIINSILDFSKVESGKLELDEVEFELQHLLDTVTTLVAQKCASKGLELVYDIGPDVPPAWVGDSQRLGQVLTNLLNNALKFTDEGVIRVTARRERDGETGDMARFCITDTGIGMTEQQSARLFQSFHQADSSISRKYGGTGLGLAICKKFVELMGGRIGVDSVPGQGSTFWFTMPLKLERAGAAPAPLIQPPADDLRQRLAGIQGARVLLVEDNDINQIVAAEILAEAGLVVDLAENGLQAVEMVQYTRYDVVLMDMQMPVMDGIEATRTIRRLDGFAGLPIVAMTANAMPSDRQRCLDAGMDAYVSKPIQPEELWAVLQATIRQAHAAGMPA